MTSIKRELGGIALGVLVASSTAYAQPLTPDEPATCPAPTGCPVEPGQGPVAQATPPPPAYQPPPPSEPSYTTSEMATEETYERPWYSRFGLGISVGGGVTDFAKRTMRDTTHTGGAWTARVTAGTHSYLALEGSYIGTAQSIDAIGLDKDAILISNGGQGVLRLNATTDAPFQPFIFGGGAWSHYSLTNKNINVSDVRNSDNVWEVPAGVGIAGYFGSVMMDVRGEYRFSFSDNLVLDPRTGTFADMARWGVTGTLGYSF